MLVELEEIGIAGYQVKHIEELRFHSIVHLQRKQSMRPACPCCRPEGAPDERSESGRLRVYSKGPYLRRVRHLDAFGRTVLLWIHTHRYQCRHCGLSFIPPLPGIKPYRHSSEPFRKAIYQQHRDGIAGSVLAHREGIGSASVERFYHEYTEVKAGERSDGFCPPVLGIDEHSIHRKRTRHRRGTRFATTLCNLRTHRVFDVVEGRDPKDLDAYFTALKGKENVRIICMDLSSSYRALVRKHFPNAKIVADRFHVIRVIQQHFMNLVRQIAPEVKNHRGYLAALRTHPDKLFPQQKAALQRLFADHPTLEPIYEQMNKTNQLMRTKNINAREARKLIPELLELIETLKDSGFKPIITLAKTLANWDEAIVCMWRFDMNTKMPKLKQPDIARAKIALRIDVTVVFPEDLAWIV
ncbi:MAG: ISL3 family transposase, partial [Verrucomicrobiota bacterium]